MGTTFPTFPIHSGTDMNSFSNQTSHQGQPDNSLNVDGHGGSTLQDLFLQKYPSLEAFRGESWFEMLMNYVDSDGSYCASQDANYGC